MINLNEWLNKFTKALDGEFGERVRFVGIQGSYARGEATLRSDLDAVVILDTLSADDINRYSALLDTLPSREYICGFLSGYNELTCWEASDLFQFYYDTTPIKGTLAPLESLISDEAVARAIKTGVCNIYHGCVHNMVHEKSGQVLTDLYKSASFVLRAIAYQDIGRYISTNAELFEVLSGDDKEIMRNVIAIRKGNILVYEDACEKLFVWAQKKLEKF